MTATVVTTSAALSKKKEVVETCIEVIPFVSNNEANSQARGLETWLHSGKECVALPESQHLPWTTNKDLDSAMLATREFWFESPPDVDQAWDPLLSA